MCPAHSLDSLTLFPSLPGPSSLCEASPHPWADRGACPSVLPMWPLGQTLSPPHKGIDAVPPSGSLGTQSPKTQSKRHNSECNSRCPDDHCYDRGSRDPRPQSSESSTPSHPPHLFQFQGPSLPCLNPGPQFCFISLILHLRVAPFFSHPTTNCLGRLHNGEGEHKL